MDWVCTTIWTTRARTCALKLSARRDSNVAIKRWEDRVCVLSMLFRRAGKKIRMQCCNCRETVEHPFGTL